MITAERRAKMREYVEKDIQYKWPDCQGSAYALELLDEIEASEKQMKEKDAMIDWLAGQLAYNAVLIMPTQYLKPSYGKERDKIKFWRDEAQDAVRKAGEGNG